MSGAPARYYKDLRRAGHQPLPLIDPVAVAVAHHRKYHADSFCMNQSRASCENIDDTDREYAAEMVEVLMWLPEFTN